MRYNVRMTSDQQNQNEWLKELMEQRRALKRQLFAVDSQSASISSGGGSKSYTSRSVKDIKEKIAAVENEIVAVCGELEMDVPFKTSRGVYTIKTRFA